GLRRWCRRNRISFPPQGHQVELQQLDDLLTDERAPEGERGIPIARVVVELVGSRAGGDEPVERAALLVGRGLTALERLQCGCVGQFVGRGYVGPSRQRWLVGLRCGSAHAIAPAVLDGAGTMPLAPKFLTALDACSMLARRCWPSAWAWPCCTLSSTCACVFIHVAGTPMPVSASRSATTALGTYCAVGSSEIAAAMS